MKIYVIYEEYEEGSRQGEVVSMLSAHRTETEASKEIKALQQEHAQECDLAQEAISEMIAEIKAEEGEYASTDAMVEALFDEGGWCTCGVGFNYEEVELKDDEPAH